MTNNEIFNQISDHLNNSKRRIERDEVIKWIDFTLDIAERYPTLHATGQGDRRSRTILLINRLTEAHYPELLDSQKEAM